MGPFIAILASVLANKMNSDRERQQLGVGIRRNQAAKMGGDTSRVDAILGRKQIENNESNAMTNTFIQQLVGQLGQKAAPGGTDVKNSMLRGAIGSTGLTDPQADLDAPYDPKTRAITPGVLERSASDPGESAADRLREDQEEQQRRLWRSMSPDEVKAQQDAYNRSRGPFSR